MDETKQLTTPGLEKRFVGVLPTPNQATAPFLLAPRFTQGRERERQWGKFLVGLQCTARKRKRERKGKVAGAADFYSWAAPSLDGRP